MRNQRNSIQRATMMDITPGVFEYELYEETPTICRSKSEDDRMWSPLEHSM